MFDTAVSTYQPYRPLAAALGAERCCAAPQCAPPGQAQGSRRRRLWELEPATHCPVVGACLPMPVLRRLVDKTMGGEVLGRDYEVHCGAVSECRLRSPLAEALHKELDRRYAVALRQSAQAKTPEALEAWWRKAADADLAGAFWATLTHARCTSDLQLQVLGEVHMLQHQVGAAQRLDRARFDLASEENQRLRQELAQLQLRYQQHTAEQVRTLERAHAAYARLHAQKLAQDACIRQLRDQLAGLEQASPGLGARIELARQNQAHSRRIADLEQQLRLARRESDEQRRRAADAWQQHRAGPEAASPPEPPSSGAGGGGAAAAAASTDQALLSDRAVLCVGGRPASVPLYRHIVERNGGRFLHHDGGEQESVARLESTLSAADLVICQTGCISHDAYWRVKHHCKRTGKRCVFVDNPGGASLKRALEQLQGGPA